MPGGCGHLHPETTVWLGAPIPGAGGLCRICEGRVGQAIAQMPRDVVQLSVLIGAGGGADQGGKIRSTPTPPIPIRVGIEALRAQIDHELQCWVEPVAESLGVEWDTARARRSRLAPRVQRAAAFLSGAVPALLALPAQEHSAWLDGEPLLDADGCQDTVCRDGVDGALGLLELHRRVFAVSGWSRLVHRLMAPCPWCSQRMVTQENGSDEKRCQSEVCRGRLVPERSADWLAAVVEHETRRQRSGKAAA